MNKLHKLLALAAFALMPSLTALAQNVVMNMAQPDSKEDGVSKLTVGGVTAQYILANGTPGVYIYNPDWTSYYFTLTSSQPIAVIELDGKSDTRSTSYTADIQCSTGKLQMHPDETSIWQGNATSITFKGARSSSRYFITEIRIWFVGTPYGKQYVKDPVISVSNGLVKFDSETPDASFTYSMQFDADGKVRMCEGTAPLNLSLLFSVQGEASGCEPSSKVSKTVSLGELYGKRGDANGDGVLNVTDVQTIINNLLNQLAQ